MVVEADSIVNYYYYQLSFAASHNNYYHYERLRLSLRVASVPGGGSERGSNATIEFAAQEGRQKIKDKNHLYDENDHMAVNGIDAMFSSNSNFFLLTLKHRLRPRSKQECEYRVKKWDLV
eukprot:6196467-Pleurochrysis_carterae.AAC.1